MTNIINKVVTESNSFFPNTSSQDAVFATNSNNSSIFIGASNTSNYLSIAPGKTTVNNDLSVVGEANLTGLSLTEDLLVGDIISLRNLHSNYPSQNWNGLDEFKYMSVQGPSLFVPNTAFNSNDSDYAHLYITPGGRFWEAASTSWIMSCKQNWKSLSASNDGNYLSTSNIFNNIAIVGCNIELTSKHGDIKLYSRYNKGVILDSESNITLTAASNVIVNATRGISLLHTGYGVGYSNQGTPLFLSKKIDRAYSNWYVNIMNDYLNNVNSNDAGKSNPTFASPFSGMIIASGTNTMNSLFLSSGGSPTSGQYSTVQSKLYTGAGMPLLINPDGGNVGINLARDMPGAQLHIKGHMWLSNGNLYGSNFHPLFNCSPWLGNNNNRFSYLYASNITSTNQPTTGSDDRIKTDEEIITNATDTLIKLRPQIYNKWSTMDYINDSNATFIKEAGLIAQEIFYDAPELRHLVKVPEDASSNIYEYVPSSSNPQDDPIAYSLWGCNTASVNYIGLIPYLIKSLQELNEKIDTL
jgi:hypothetical protein